MDLLYVGLFYLFIFLNKYLPIILSFLIKNKRYNAQLKLDFLSISG